MCVSRPPITIRFQDLHASDIKRVVGEIVSYHENDATPSPLLDS
jgi:hypothetical protein